MARILSTLTTQELAVYWQECRNDNPRRASEWESLVKLAGITPLSKRWYVLLLANAETHGWTEDLGWVNFYTRHTF